jgi:PKHD-type hydroxylase
MIVNPHSVISEKFLPDQVCQDIIDVAFQQKEQDATVQAGPTDGIRDSRVVWLRDTWIYDWVAPAMRELNSELEWNFNLTEPEPIQFTIYKKGQFYGWHQDTFEPELNKSMSHQRKISAVIPLVDSDSYEGGDLQFYNSSINPNKKQEDKIEFFEQSRIKGSMIVFPSYIYHQVTPILSGQRLSIVIWYQGEKWQ